MNRHPPFVVLDEARAPHEHVTLFGDSAGVVTAQLPDDVDAAFVQIEAALARGLHVAGYFTYELGYALEPKLAPRLPENRNLPLLWLGLFRRREDYTGTEAEDFFSHGVRGRAYAGPVRFAEPENAYASAFARVQECIAAGDIYQANLTLRGRFPFVGDPLAFYLRLRAHCAAAHCAYIDDGQRQILSLSPELFFRIDNGVITAKPMKGTAARADEHSQDARARMALQTSDKERAENLMIVDLIRNDLGRISEIGSVSVTDLFSVESYPTVHQMVSKVRARLRSGTRLRDIVRALFPCGSVTGAPKIRAMEILSELEKGSRGVYCGAIGAFAPDGSARFNVGIRTIVIANGEGALGVGSGIVADSQVRSEFEECLLKSQFLSCARRPTSLIETLRYAPDQGFAYLELHLDRMCESAIAFGIPFDREAAMVALESEVARAGEPHRVRLELFEDGTFACRAGPLGATPPYWLYVISERAVNSMDEMLRHKTSWREAFEDELVRASQLTGCDEVIFVNERGEITEGSRSNVFARFGDHFITPPLSSGLLNGCLRRALIGNSAAQCTEGVLFPDDLVNAEAVYLGNAVRGLVTAVPVSTRILGRASHAATRRVVEPRGVEPLTS